MITIPLKKFKKINGTRISYIDEGNGETIFCLPPWPSPSLVFVPLISQIDKSFRIISPDIPGWTGNSQKPESTPDLTFYTELIEDFIKSFGIRKINLLGYSYGGIIAQQIASRNKVAVKNLALISSPFGLGSVNEKFRLVLDFYDKIGQKLIPDRTVLELVKDLMFLPMLRRERKTKRNQFDSLIEKIAIETDNVDARSLLLCFLSKKPVPVNLEKIKKNPVLIIYSEKDESFIKKDNEMMTIGLGIKPVFLSESDHCHLFFESEKSAKTISNFFSRKNIIKRVLNWFQKNN